MCFSLVVQGDGRSVSVQDEDNQAQQPHVLDTANAQPAVAVGQ